jgi:hypothetical protein
LANFRPRVKERVSARSGWEGVMKIKQRAEELSPAALNNHQAFGSSKLCLELARGIEPPTVGLQNRCSAVELRQLSNPLSITVPLASTSQRKTENAKIWPDEDETQPETY